MLVPYLQQKVSNAKTQLILQDFKIDNSLSNLNFSYSDSLMLDLKDQKKAKSSDSLWLKELYDSTRFEEVFGSITSEEIELTEYEDLPTELA